jgi:zinc protease
MRTLRWISAAALAVGSLGCATPAREDPRPAETSEPAPDAAKLARAVAAAQSEQVRCADEPLVCDPRLTTGTLPNGLRYVVRRHGNPAGRMSLWMHVASGSLNESEEQRGLAHFLEHLAFNGSANFPPGSCVPFFQSLGLRFGNDQNAFTNYGETTYQLALPNARPETLGKALLFFSDVATKLSLLPQEIDDERQIILEEKRARGGGSMRVREHVAARVAPESTYGRRMPIGVEDQIRKFTQEDFRDYYGRFYKVSNMTLMAVGDQEPSVVVEEIRKAFADAPAEPRPSCRDCGAKPTQGRRAIVAQDAEITNCTITFLRVAPPRPPTTMTSRLRGELVEELAVRAFGRRSRRLTAAGKASYLEAGCGSRDVACAMTQFSASARTAPGKWRKSLVDLGATLQTARLHGFTDREVELARRAIVAEAEEREDREATSTAREILQRMNADVGHEEPILSAAQRLAATRALLPTISTRECSELFAARFDPTNVVFILEIPSSAKPPTEEEFLGLATAAADVTPEAPAEVEAPDAVLPEPAAGGKVAESSVHEGAAVVSAWLENGVRVHAKRMDVRRNEVTVTITFPGGAIEETEKDRGVCEAAAQAWARPAGGGFTAGQISDLMLGKKAHVRGSAGLDTMTLTVAGDPSGLEDGLKLAHLLLTEPTVEPRTLGGWQTNMRQSIAARKLNPVGVMGEAIDDAFFGKDDVRNHALETSQTSKVKSADATAKLREIARTRPCEVAVVGDVDPDAALALVAKHLGALPARPRIGPTALAELRTAKPPTGPIVVNRDIPVMTPEAVVNDGFFGADASNRRDARALDVAARVLTSRMIAEIRERRQLVYSVRCGSRPAVVFPGMGTFGVQAPTDPAKAAALADCIEEMFAAFAKDGPTEAEMTVALGQAANQLDEEMRNPAAWTSFLSTMDYRGNDLDAFVAGPAAVQKVTAAEVRSTFERYWRPEARYRFIVTPTGGAAKPEGAADDDE